MTQPNLSKQVNELLILATLRSGPAHGYEIALAVERDSGGAFSFQHGTLYPILHRLEKDGLIDGGWDEDGGRRRKVYGLTPRGRERPGPGPCGFAAGRDGHDAYSIVLGGPLLFGHRGTRFWDLLEGRYHALVVDVRQHLGDGRTSIHGPYREAPLRHQANEIQESRLNFGAFTIGRLAMLAVILLCSPASTAAQAVEGSPEIRILLAPSLDTNLDRARDWLAPGKSAHVRAGRTLSIDPPPPSANGWVLLGSTLAVAATFGYLAGSVGENVGVDKDRMMVVALSLGLFSSVVFCVRAECRW